MQKRRMTKEIFLKAVQCRTLGWFERSSSSEQAPTFADQVIIKQGLEVGKLARQLYPTGVLVSPGSEAPAETNRLMADARVDALFEATFESAAFTAKADVALRTTGGWSILEVKSKLVDTPDMDDLVADLAYTVLVARNSGVRVTRASLLLLSRDFRKGMPSGQLFVEIDHTAAVDEMAPLFDKIWAGIERTTGGDTRPSAVLSKTCKTCAYFETSCLGAGIAHPVTEIPRLGEQKLVGLGAAGIVDIASLPADFQLTAPQSRVVDAVRKGAPFVGSVRAALQGVAWPAFYLDFETVQTAIPLYQGMAPHTQIPTQYSIHCCAIPGRVTAHHEYLADPLRDCQRELAERLIGDLGTSGSIVVYSSFEKTRVRALATKFPDLAPALAAIEHRLIDLQAVIAKEYYHPDFHGSTSIKDVLPVLVHDLSYDGMGIRDGGSASAAFALVAGGAFPQPEAERLLGLLREYCAQDTLAMVKLHEALLAL